MRHISFSIAALAAAALLGSTSLGQAAGFASSHSGMLGAAVSAKALAKNYGKFSTPRVKLRISNYAKTVTQITHNTILEGKAIAGNNIHLVVAGKSCNSTCGNGWVKLYEKSDARTKIYIKGKNILAKARARNYARLKARGKLLYEYESTAIALARFTPLGTQAAAYAQSQSRVATKSFVRYSSGNQARSVVRTNR